MILLLILLSLISHASLDITSHKTAGLEYAENSIEGFEHSLNLPVQSIEIDIHFTKDRHMVLSHDPVLDNYNCFKTTSSNKVIIAQTDLAEILKINCYNRKVKKPYKIPTLDSVLQSLKASGRADLDINFEIKVFDKLIENWERYQYFNSSLLHIPEEEMASLAMEKLRHWNLDSKIIFASFSRELLLKLKNLQQPHENFRYALLFKGTYSPIKLGLLAALKGKSCYNNCWWPNWVEVYSWIEEHEIDIFMPHWPQLKHPLFSYSFNKVFQGRKLPFKVLPWTLNKKEDWQKALNMDFDGIVTDSPSELIEQLSSEH